MNEQPPSAKALPSDIQHLLDSLDTDVALLLAARIKALIAQRVSAETERGAQLWRPAPEVADARIAERC